MVDATIFEQSQVWAYGAIFAFPLSATAICFAVCRDAQVDMEAERPETDWAWPEREAEV